MMPSYLTVALLNAGLAFVGQSLDAQETEFVHPIFITVQEHDESGSRPIAIIDGVKHDLSY